MGIEDGHENGLLFVIKGELDEVDKVPEPLDHLFGVGA